MIRLNQTTEYALIALRHIKDVFPEKTSAREIAEKYSLPFEITAKTLQRLKDTGLVESTYGAKGGYSLKPEQLSMSVKNFLTQLEGDTQISDCCHGFDKCDRATNCTIKHGVTGLNQKIQDFLAGLSLNDVISNPNDII